MMLTVSTTHRVLILNLILNLNVTANLSLANQMPITDLREATQRTCH